MDGPKVSVITPTYNRARRLLECIESVRRQRYPDVEHIVVDDGSTDGTTERVAGMYAALLGSERLRLIRQENAGPGAARNAGLQAARGEFVTYVDSDDLLLDSHVAELMAPMMTDARIGVTYGSHIEMWLDANGRSLRQSTGPERPVDPLRLRFKNEIPIMFMHRRCLVDEIGGFEEARRGLEDWDFLMRLSEVTVLQGVPALTCVWRHFAGGSCVTSELQGEERELEYQKVVKRGRQRQLDGKIRIEALATEAAELNRIIFGDAAA